MPKNDLINLKCCMWPKVLFFIGTVIPIYAKKEI